MTSINYDKENYCVECDLKFPKSVTKCPNCKNKLRTRSRKPWKNKTRMRFKCTSCGNLYGDCACICCLADEINV